MPFNSKVEFEYCMLKDEQNEGEKGEEETDKIKADCFKMEAQFDCIYREGGGSDAECDENETDKA